jgi:uncharacterized protein YoxC
MQPLDSIVIIAEIILFLALALLAIYLMISIKKMTESVTRMEKDFDELQKKVAPVLENALFISNNVKEISTGIKTQVAKVDHIVDSIKDTTDSMIRFEQKTQRQVESTLGDSLNFISAIIIGFKTFFTALSSTNNKHPRKNHIRSFSEVADSSEEDI